jgi:MFS family permease
MNKINWFLILKRLKKWLVLIGTGLIGFTIGMDFTSLNALLPSIQSDFSANSPQIKFILLGFSLFFASFLVIMDYLSDCYGRRKFLIFSIIFFNLASFGAGYVKTTNLLIVMRSLQGLFAAAIIPCVTVLTAHIFPKKNRANLVIGAYGSLVGFGISFGPILGESIANNFNWRWVFLINIPLTLISLIIFIFMYSELKLSQKNNLDWIGSILCVLILGSLTFIVCEGEHYGWISWSIISLHIFVFTLLFVIFLYDRKVVIQKVPSLYLFRNTDFFLPLFVYSLSIVDNRISFLIPFYLIFYFADLPIIIIKQIVITKGALSIKTIKNILKDGKIFIGDVIPILRHQRILVINNAENFSQYNIYRKLDALRLRTKLAFREINDYSKSTGQSAKISHHLSEPLVLLATIIVGVLIFVYVLMGFGVAIISSIILWLK